MDGKRSKYLIGGLVAMLLAFATVTAQENYSTWGQNLSISLNTSSTGAAVATDQYNFPVLIRLTTANAATIFNTAQTNGGDIRFAKADGTHLPFELSKWDQTNKKAFIWVLLDTVKGNSTTQTIKIFWAKAGVTTASDSSKVFVPANGFLSVLHLNKMQAGSDLDTFFDATGQANHGFGGHSCTDTDAVIDRGRAFHCSGTPNSSVAGDSIKLANLLGSPATVTISSWIRLDSIDQANTSGNGHRANIISMGNCVSINDGGGDGTGIDSVYGAWKAGSTWNNVGYYPSTGNQQTMLKQGWKHVAMVLNPGAGFMNLYLNGDSVKTFAAPTAIAYNDNRAGGTRTVMGKAGTADVGEKFGGSLCEVRFDGVARSSDWIKLCYMNQSPANKLVPWSSVTPVMPTTKSGIGAALRNDLVVKNGAIEYAVATPGMVEISFSDILGRTALTINRKHAAGHFSLGLKTFNLAAGSYIVRMKAVGVEQSGKVTITK